MAALTLPRLQAEGPAARAKQKAQSNQLEARDINAERLDDDDKEANERLAKDVGEFDITVVGPEGKPIPEAKVFFDSTPLPTLEQFSVGKFIRKGDNYGIFVDANAEGRIVMKIPSNPGRLEVRVQMPGFGPYSTTWSSENPSQQIPAKFTVELEGGWTVGGIVIDRDKQPVAGVELHPSIKFKKRPGDPRNLHVGQSVKTDAEGKWRFESIPDSKESVHVEINHPDFQPSSGSFSRTEFGLQAGQQPARETVLERGLSVVGTITDENGQPIVGARVRTKYINSVRETTSDENGDYVLRGCYPAMSRIVVNAKGRALDMQQLRIDPEMDPVDFVMKPGGKIRVRVLDEFEKPVPKSRIFFQRWRDRQIEYFEFDGVNQYCDENGVWEWNEAPLDAFSADICPTNGPQVSYQNLQAREEEYVFRTSSALIISGNVVDAITKKPIERFEVVPGHRYENGRLNWDQKGRFTATEGQYKLRPDNGRLSYIVRIEASGHRAAMSRDVKLDEGIVTINFELEPSRDLEAKVLSPDGSPAVEARIAMGIMGTQIEIENGDFREISTYCAIKSTDSKGELRMIRQEIPLHLAIVHPTGFSDLVINPDDEIPATIELQAWGRIEGNFRVGPKPEPNATLSIGGVGINTYGQNEPRFFTRYRSSTDQNGHYVFERVFPGHARIGREIVMMVNEGALTFTSSCHIPVDAESGKTVLLDLGGTGRPVIGQLQAPANQPKIDWKQHQVQIETVLPELPVLRDPDIPAEANGNVQQRLAWLQKYELTKEGKAWVALKHAHEANELRRNSSPRFRATLNTNGEFRFDDVPEGEYVIQQLFGHGKTRFSVPHMEDGRSDEVLDLGLIRADDVKN